jgi:hypothetical protein
VSGGLAAVAAFRVGLGRKSHDAPKDASAYACHVTTLAAIFPPKAPEQIGPVAWAAERAGLAQLWIWDDCFKESGIATAAAMLATTSRITVAIGLLPAPLRTLGWPKAAVRSASSTARSAVLLASNGAGSCRLAIGRRIRITGERQPSGPADCASAAFSTAASRLSSADGCPPAWPVTDLAPR